MWHDPQPRGHDFHQNTPSYAIFMNFLMNWLRVLGTAERSYVDHRVPQQLHAVVPLLDAFKS
jgi:hypothetical protein